MRIMVMRCFVTLWTEYVQWFYYKPWERSELISLSLIVTSLLMVIVRERQKIRHSRQSRPSGTS